MPLRSRLLTANQGEGRQAGRSFRHSAPAWWLRPVAVARWRVRYPGADVSRIGCVVRVRGGVLFRVPWGRRVVRLRSVARPWIGRVAPSRRGRRAVLGARCGTTSARAAVWRGRSRLRTGGRRPDPAGRVLVPDPAVPGRRRGRAGCRVLVVVGRAAEQPGPGGRVGRAADERCTADSGNELEGEQPTGGGSGGRGEPAHCCGWAGAEVGHRHERGARGRQAGHVLPGPGGPGRLEQCGQRGLVRTRTVEEVLITAAGTEAMSTTHDTLPAPAGRLPLLPGAASRRAASVLSPRCAATRTAPGRLPSTAPADFASSPTTARSSTASA